MMIRISVIFLTCCLILGSERAFGDRGDRKTYSILFSVEVEDREIILNYRLKNLTYKKLVIYKESLPEGIDITRSWLNLYLYRKRGHEPLKAESPLMVSPMGLKVEIPSRGVFNWEG